MQTFTTSKCDLADFSEKNFPQVLRLRFLLKKFQGRRIPLTLYKFSSPNIDQRVCFNCGC